jgi:hypothetical protein
LIVDDDGLRSRVRLARSSLLLVSLAAAACSGEPAPALAAEITDSAGVRVVMNLPPETAPEWRVAEIPEVEIGIRAEGRLTSVVDPAYVLWEIKGAVRLSDGTIVVANGGTLDLRYYTPQGQLIVRAGRSGNGPGEFADISLVGVLPGDSVVVNDVRHRVISVYDRRGQLIRTHRLSGEFGAFPNPVGVLDDGSLFLSQRSLEPAEGEFRERGGNLRTTGRVIVAGPDGMERRFLGDFPGAETQCINDAARGLLCPVGSGILFGRRLFGSAAHDRIALATSDSFSVRILDGHGGAIHIVRQRREPMEVRDADYERVRAAMMERFPEGLLPELERGLDAMPRRETYPAFEGIRLDRAGELWVEESRRPGDDGRPDVTASTRPVWQVFDRQGFLIGRVEAPAGLQITDSGPDYILGVAKDDLDVERVRLYRVERPAARRPS